MPITHRAFMYSCYVYNTMMIGRHGPCILSSANNAFIRIRISMLVMSIYESSWLVR
jgi:hypothetical protein